MMTSAHRATCSTADACSEGCLTEDLFGSTGQFAKLACELTPNAQQYTDTFLFVYSARRLLTRQP
jgi:hypothetical protein